MIGQARHPVVKSRTLSLCNLSQLHLDGLITSPDHISYSLSLWVALNCSLSLLGDLL